MGRAAGAGEGCTAVVRKLFKKYLNLYLYFPPMPKAAASSLAHGGTAAAAAAAAATLQELLGSAGGRGRERGLVLLLGHGSADNVNLECQA